MSRLRAFACHTGNFLHLYICAPILALLIMSMLVPLLCVALGITLAVAPVAVLILAGWLAREYVKEYKPRLRTLAPAILLLPLLLSGCMNSALLGKPSEKAAQYAAKGIIFYCTNTVEALRAPFRERVNELADPYSAQVDCDPTDNRPAESITRAPVPPGTPPGSTAR